MGGTGSKHHTGAHRPNYKDAPVITGPPAAAASTESGKLPGVKLNKEVLDFGGLGDGGAVAVIPLNEVINDSMEITNNNDFSVKYMYERCFPREFQLSFHPASGTVKAHRTRRVKARLIIRSKVNVNYRIALNIDPGGSHFVVAKIRCETGLFGVEPSTLDMVEDPRGRRVPVILEKLRQALVDCGGLESEGVFRLAGEQTLLKQLKQQINAGDMTLPREPNCVATLIKIWYRELPQPLLNSLPPEKIFYSAEVQDCVEALGLLPQLQRTLLDWLVDLLLSVAENRRATKMTAQNLAIVVAPNLYEATTSDPMEGLVMSQKAVQFVHNILVNRVRERERELGRPLNTELGQEELARQPVIRVDKKVQTEPQSSSPATAISPDPAAQTTTTTTTAKEQQPADDQGEVATAGKGVVASAEAAERKRKKHRSAKHKSTEVVGEGGDPAAL